MILTIISAYYDKSPRDIEFLKRRINHFHILREIYPDIKMIIVDDGSEVVPINVATKGLDLTGITLARIKEDLGFNSHGARNLGMHLTTTDWNLLIDLDYDLSSIDFNELIIHDRNVIVLVVFNVYLIHKDLFWECKGYDEEFVNMHHGDRIFFEYFKDRYEIRIAKCGIKYYRAGRKIVESDRVSKTDYSDNKYVLVPKEHYNKRKEIENIVRERHRTGDFSKKKILNFKWEVLS